MPVREGEPMLKVVNEEPQADQHAPAALPSSAHPNAKKALAEIARRVATVVSGLRIRLDYQL